MVAQDPKSIPAPVAKPSSWIEAPCAPPPNDFWLCLSWDAPHAQMCLVDPEPTIQSLIKTCGDWDKLLAQTISNELPKAKVLAVMRVGMGMPAFDKDIDFLLPTQEYVYAKMIEFVRWYADQFGKPKVKKEPAKTEAGKTEGAAQTATSLAAV